VKKADARRVYHRQRAPFHDCDPLGIVWHGHYYKYLECAREALFESHGLTIPFFMERRMKLVVIESRCRHAFPIRLGEHIAVRAWFKDWEQRLHVAYEVRNETHGRRAARAWTTLVPMVNDEMLLETPDEIRDRIAAAV